MHNVGSKKELKTYRPVVIINVVCKLFMMMLIERINGWVEESGMLSDIQEWGSEWSEGQRITFLMLERMIDMVNLRKESLSVVFIDMKKAYDRVNRNKLFKVMIGYEVQ